MKLADRTVEVHSAGINSSNQFTIAQTSKMFKILSDSLYSDKVMAVVRELSTNAFDSHISAGNKNPFLVKLPTAADPNFTVRDYGTGLSQADMESLYTTYGASNKNDSNDFVGCLGLGSKSPFAYTKSFSTTSYFNGKQYTYIAAIDDSGVPTLNLIHSCDTDEPNGLAISFAVKQQDFREFSQKSIRIFHYFKNKPIIHGGVDWDFSGDYSNRNIVIDGDGWRVCRFNNGNNLFPNSYHRINSGIIALMGNIAYPVQVEHLIGEEKSETPDHIAKWNRAFNKADIASWKSFVSEIIDQGLYLELDFGIGELEMDVSREGLQYTKNVIKALRDKTQDIFLELKKNFSDKIASAKTKAEAIMTYYQMNDLAGGWGVGASWTDPSGTVHNINSGNDLEYKLKKSKNLYVFNYRTAGYRSRRMVYLTDKIHHETLTGKGSYYWNNSSRKNGSMTFFWCDMSATETAKKIVTKYCNQNDCFAYLMVDTDDHNDVNKGFDDLVNDVGASNILNVSDYRDLIKNTSSSKKPGIKKGSVSDQDIFLVFGDDTNTNSLSLGYNSSAYMRSMNSDRLDSFLEEDEIIYVPILRYAPLQGFPNLNVINSWSKSEGSKNMIKELFDNQNIYAIKQSSVTKLQNDGLNLIDFNTWLKQRLKTLMKNKFGELSKFNSLVDKCKKEYNSDDNMGRGYSEGYLDRQFMFHMLNLFGLDYASHINNKTLVDALDNTMTIEFFADTVHRGNMDIARFSTTEYFGHMTKLLTKIGINGLDSKKIKETNIYYNQLKSFISGMYKQEDTDNSTEYSDLLNHVSSDSYTLENIKTTRNKIKNELDKNPLLKYIITVRPVSGDLRQLQKDSNPLKQLDERNRYHWDKADKWYSSLSDVDALRKQISNIIG